ncbi:transporter, putative [Plasmodium sp. gorilla clade G2]|uniref:transporter, putative n=1 Tax=Plasmodium sp. gorilla clade G2 TaxID=880535 RepID=UPI000D20791F|nr:transporter, putative [Plasmodium sp. gorilla clade G2]SOV11853.1 transporter, putative [Plasmodium sp. gorilla clade G2]
MEKDFNGRSAKSQMKLANGIVENIESKLKNQLDNNNLINKNNNHEDVMCSNVKLSVHDDEYDMKNIKKDVCNLSKISEERLSNNMLLKGNGQVIKNPEIDTKTARQQYKKRLNSTQSTMNIEGNIGNEKDNIVEYDDDELIRDMNYEMSILKYKRNINNNSNSNNNNNNNNNVDNRRGNINEECYDESYCISNNLDELTTNGNNLSFYNKLRMCFNYFGPGWIVAIAYLDPGNLCSNLNVGLIRSPDTTLEKDYSGYYLLWIMVYGHMLGFIFQVLSMRLGHVTGLDLASLCSKEFDRTTSTIIYVLVQIAIWGAHIQAIIGTFIALNLIFGISVKVAIFYTLFEAIVYSFLENKSLGLLENVLSFLVGILAVSFIVNVFMTPINFKELAVSILFPRIPKGKEIDALALLGSIISAHIFYLHTNLTSKKKSVICNDLSLRRYNTLGTIESGGSLFLSCLTNCIIVLTFAEVNLPSFERRDQYNLFTAYEVMRKSFGKISMYIWSFGLLSSGNNSSFMCEYASKSVVEGFLNKKINTFVRVYSFRFFLFSLLYMFLTLNKYTLDQLTNFINVIQVLLLPMATIPLYRFSIHENVLGEYRLKRFPKYAIFLIIIAIIVSNVLLTFLDFVHKETSLITIIFIVTFSFIYFGFIIYFFNIPIKKNYIERN